MKMFSYSQVNYMGKRNAVLFREKLFYIRISIDTNEKSNIYVVVFFDTR